jgi:hypothetical protein
LDGASSTFSGNRWVQTKKPPAPTSIGLGETHTFKAPGVRRPPKKLYWLPAAALHQEADKSIIDIARPPPLSDDAAAGADMPQLKILLASLPRQRLDLFDKGESATFSDTQGRSKLPGRPCNRSLAQARQFLLRDSPVLAKASDRAVMEADKGIDIGWQSPMASDSDWQRRPILPGRLCNRPFVRARRPAP